MRDNPSGNPGTNSAQQSIGSLTKSVADSTFGFIRARLLLLKLEAREAGARLALRSALFLSAASLFTLAYFITVAAGISLLAERFETRWEYIAFFAAAAHIIIGVIVSIIARTVLAKPLFEESLKELDKDRQWLQEKQNR